MGLGLNLVPFMAISALMGALLCSAMAVILKPLNLGLLENIALGAVCGAGSAYLLRAAQVEPIGLAVVIQFFATLSPMVVIGLWLNARAR